MVVQVDSREKPKAIKKIINEFNKQGVQYFISKVYAGDYMSLDNPRLVVDRKQNLSEICSNVGSTAANHERFKRELMRANELGIKVVVLIEHGHGFKTLEDVKFWDNPRLSESPNATDGIKLYKILKTMCHKYNMEVQFCDKEETGKKILEILGNDSRGN